MASDRTAKRIENSAMSSQVKQYLRCARRTLMGNTNDERTELVFQSDAFDLGWDNIDRSSAIPAGRDVATFFSSKLSQIGAVMTTVPEDRAMGLDRTFQRQFLNIHFAGHSLGGGLGTSAALATRSPAVVFNPAGVHPYTVSSWGRGSASIGHATSYVTSFRTSDDPLNNTHFILDMLLPYAVGSEYVLEENWNQMYNGHSMNQVMSGLIYLDEKCDRGFSHN